MTGVLISIAIIAAVAFVAPMLAQLIPGKPFPEVVFIILIGAVLGSNLLGIIAVTPSIDLLMELGLAFLFLLAGYEIEPELLAGERGRVATGTWFVSFAVALGIVMILPGVGFGSPTGFALAIAMTSTAIGTIFPILKERDHDSGPMGKNILAHGMAGELFPILAIALLLSTRSTVEVIIVLVTFLVIAIFTAVIPKLAANVGSKIWDFIEHKAESTSQTMVRFTILILTGLVAIAAAFQLDIVLGAFAAGFILRFLFPDGNYDLEKKLEGVAYGFFIPLFFAVSGANIDLKVVVEEPGLLLGFVGVIIIARAIPVLLSTYVLASDREDLNFNDRLTISLYAATALPIIVAVTAVATRSDFMDETTASILVSAGALTVLLMPALTTLTSRVVASQPIEAASELIADPARFIEIMRHHQRLSRENSLRLLKDKRQTTKELGSSMRESLQKRVAKKEEQEKNSLNDADGASAEETTTDRSE